MTILADLSQAEMMAKMEAALARQAELEGMVARLKAQGQRKLTLKVSEKGALSLYGLGRFPLSLYKSQWERVLGEVEAIRAFLADHADQLSEKGE